jgi:CBS domain-containing protein
MAMLISELLRRKGADVLTLTPDTTVRDLVAILTERRIGAAVISKDGTHVEGIASERDVVTALAARGAAVLSDDVGSIMTREVHTCGLDATVNDLMVLMTQQRVRHVPVVVEGTLRGIVSIGDVVKSRMLELELERDSLRDYISGRG